MDNQETYGLKAQFEFIASQDNFDRMSATQQALAGLREELKKLENTVSNSNFKRDFEAIANAGVRTTGRMGQEMGEFAQATKGARDRLSPLKAEFRALKKEVRNIEFGDIYDFKAFERAEKETRKYIKSFERLERQIQGTTFAEREFVASLKQQQRVLDSKIDIQQQERLAARSAERVGQFRVVEQVGTNMVVPFVREGKKATDVLIALNDQLSAVEAKTGATTQEMKDLEKIALRLGATSVFTAGQAASAEVFLGQAGFNAKQIYAALPSILGLAGSDSSVDLAMSADIASNILSAYDLDAMKDTARISNVLAKISAKTNTNVAQLGEAFTYGGTQAKMFNVSLEETSALLGVAGDIGIQASLAGTGLRSGLANLADASKQAQLKEVFGVDVVDQRGQIRDIIDIMGDLSVAYTTAFEERPAESLDALTKVFGKTAVGFWSAQINNYSKLQRDTLMGLAAGVEEQKLADILGINVKEGQNLYDELIRQTGDYHRAVKVLKQGIDDLIQSGQGGQGAALAMSRIMQNNLGGAFRSLSSALEAFRLAYIKPLEPLIIATTNAISGLLRFFSNLPEPIRFVISSMALLTVTMGTALVVVGSVSAALFGLSQAAATAAIATTSLARGGMIPLTGFFNESMMGLRGALELDRVMPSLSKAFQDLQGVVLSTGGATLSSFSSISRVIKLITLDFLEMSHALLFSPLGLSIGAFLVLNTVLEKVVPGLNLMGIALSGVTAIAGFTWGVVKGFTESILEFIGVTGAGGLGAVTPIFESIGNAISMAATSFELFSQSGEKLGKNLGKILVSPFLWVGKTIISIWRMTIDAIRQPLRPLADFVQSIGKLLVSFLAENSPGPTYLIREKWGMTVAFLRTQFERLIHFATLVNQAFLGIGDVTAEQQGNARVELLQEVLNIFIGGIKLIGNLFSLWQQFRNWQNKVIHETIANMDLLGFTLLTLSSLPMTLADQLLPTAKTIVKELSLLTDPGLFRGFVFTLPGIVASLIFTGTLDEFEQGFSQFLKKVPLVLSSTLDNLYLLISDEFKTQFNRGVSDAVTDLVKSAPTLFPGSEAFTFAFDLDTVYKQTKDGINTTLSNIIDYLLVVGITAKEVGKDLTQLLKPLLEFNVLGIFPQLGNIPIISALASVPLVPNFTVVQPFIKGVLEVLRSPEMKMLLNFFRSNVLDVFLKSLIGIYETLQLIAGVSLGPVIVPLMYGLNQVSLFFRSILLNTGVLVKNFADLSVANISSGLSRLVEIIRSIPFVGEVIITTFTNLYSIISNITQALKPFAIQYGKFLLRLVPTQAFKNLFFSLIDLAKVGLDGVIIFAQKNLVPLGNVLLKAFNPLSFFRILRLYFTTGGFQGILKKGIFSVTPYDFLFGNRNVAFLGRIFFDAVFPANIIRKRTTEIFQHLASPQAAAEAAKMSRRLGRNVLVPLEDILKYVPGGTGVFIRFAQAIMVLNPMVQILGRIAFTTMFWYSVLKPLTPEMLDAIAATRIFGLQLTYLAHSLRIARFLVVDLTETFKYLVVQVPQWAMQIHKTFQVIGDVVGTVTQLMVGVSAMGLNIFKALVINPLLLIPLGILEVMNNALKILQSGLKLILLKTTQYGDAISAALRGNFVPLIKQVASDVTGLIWGMTTAIANAITWPFRIVAKYTYMGGVEIIRFLQNPVRELNRLNDALNDMAANWRKTFDSYLQYLPMDDILNFLRRFKVEVLGISVLIAQITNLFGMAAIRFNPLLLAIEGIGFLIYEYKTGFKVLHGLIDALSHPIAVLNAMIDGIFGTMGAYITPGMTNFMANFAEGFVKNIPLIVSGIFLIALVIKRNIGQAFMVFVDGIQVSIQRIQALGDAINGLKNPQNPMVQSFVNNARLQAMRGEYAVRGRDQVMGVANPLAYSTNPQLQQRAAFIGSQIEIVKELMSVNKQANQELNKLIKQEERRLIQMARSRNEQDRIDVLGYIEREDTKGKIYRKQLAQAAKVTQVENAFGKRFQLTEVGKQMARINAQRRYQQQGGDIRRVDNAMDIFSLYRNITGQKAERGVAEELGDMALGLESPRGLMDEITNKLGMISSPRMDVDKLTAGVIQVTKPGGFNNDQSLKDISQIFDSQVRNNLDAIKQLSNQKLSNSQITTDLNESRIQELLKSSSYIRNEILNKLTSSNLSSLEPLLKEYNETYRLFGGKQNLLDVEKLMTEASYSALTEGNRNKLSEQVTNQIMTGFLDVLSKEISGIDDSMTADLKQLQNQNIRHSERIATTYQDMLIQGAERIYNSNRDAFDNQSLAAKIFRLTGLPQLYQQIKFNRQLGIRARELEQRSENMRFAESMREVTGQRQRQAGYQALLGNLGIEGNLAEQEQFLKRKLGDRLYNILQNYLNTGERFRVDLSQINKGYKDVLNSINIPELRNYKDNPLMGMHKVLKDAISNDEFGLTQEILDDFRKNLVKGGTDWKKFAKDLDRGGQIEDVLGIKLKRLRDSLVQIQGQTGNENILSDIADVLGSGKFSAKATKEEEEQLLAKLGLNYRQYKNLGNILPRGFFAPILAKLNKWQENVTDNFSIADHYINNIFENLKIRVAELPLIEQTALPLLERAQSLWGKTFHTLNQVTKGSFDYVTKEITQIRDNIGNLATIQAFRGLQSNIRIARENTLLNLIETRGKGKRPSNVNQFQMALMRELRSQGIEKETDVSKIIATFLQAGKDDQSLSQMLSREFKDDLEVIKQAFAKSIGVTVSEAAEAMNDPKFTARTATPIQFIFLRTLPKLFTGFASDVANSFIGKGIKYITKTIAIDVLRGFSEPSLEAIANFIRRTSAILGRGLNMASNSLIRIIGNNDISNGLQGLSQLMLKFGDKTSAFVEQVRGTIDQPSFTRHIIQRLSGLFGIISEGVQNLYNNVQQEVVRQGGVGNFLNSVFKGMVGKIKSFFGNLFRQTPSPISREQLFTENQKQLYRSYRLGERVRSSEQRIRDNVGLSPQERLKAFQDILLLRNRYQRREHEERTLRTQLSPMGRVDHILNNMMAGLGDKLPKIGDRFSQILSGRLGNLQIQRSRAQRGEGQESYYGQTVVPFLDKAFNNILQKGQSTTNQIANFFKETAERSRRSWEESGRGIISKGWKALVNTAKHTGQQIKHFIAHNSPGPASDVERIYREEVPREVNKGFRQMEADANRTGQHIQQEMSHAAQQTTGFFRHASSAASSFWQAGLGIGAALSATGFGLQTLGYSLVNLGVLEEGDQLITMFNKVGEVMSIVGVIGSVTSPLLSTTLSLVGGITSGMFALGGAITGIGGAIAGMVGLSQVTFAPLLLGITAVGVAIAGLYLAFKHNFLGIRSIATIPINFIESAWQGFVENFGFLLSPVLHFAENLGHDLIAALNCHPTIRITEAWSDTADNVQGFMGSLLGSAKELGSFISSKVGGKIDSISGNISVPKIETSFQNWQEGITKTSVMVAEVVKEILFQTRLLDKLNSIDETLMNIFHKLTLESERVKQKNSQSSIDSKSKFDVLNQGAIEKYKEFDFNSSKSTASFAVSPEKVVAANMGINYTNKKGLFGIDTSGGFGLNKRARFEYKIYDQLYNEQLDLVKEILYGSQSTSAILREKYQGLTEKINGKTILSNEGQKYIERQLAQQIQKGTGIFSQDNLSQIAQQVGLTKRLEKQGLTADRQTLVDIAVRNQGVLSDARNLYNWQDNMPNQEPIKAKSDWHTKLFDYLDKITTAVTAIAELMFNKEAIKNQSIPSILTASGANNIVPFKPQPQPIPTRQERVMAMVGTELNVLKEGITPRIGDRKPVRYEVDQQASVKEQLIQDLSDQTPVAYTPLFDKLKTHASSINNIFSNLLGNIQSAWGQTTQFISSKIGWLVNLLRPQGYEIQKALSEGSPGPSFFTRENWNTTFQSMKSGFADLVNKAKEAGKSILQGFEDTTLKDQIAESLSTAIALEIPDIEPTVKANPFSQLYEQFEETTWQIKERMDYLHRYGVDHAGDLLTPGLKQAGKSLQIFGGDILSFIGRSVKAIATLNFFELADAVKDFGGNGMYALQGVVKGLANVGMGIIAIAASLPTLIAPFGIAALIFGGIVFSSAVLVSNLLGLRTVIKGAFQVFLGLGQIAWNVLEKMVGTVKALGVIGTGVSKALKGDFMPLYQGIDMLRHALGEMVDGVVQGLKRIGFGFQDIFKGVLQGWNQLFPAFKVDIDRLFDIIGFYFNLMKDGRVAGELFASALVRGIRSVINTFKELGMAIATTMQIKFTEGVDFVKVKFNELKTFFINFQWQDLFKSGGENVIAQNLPKIGRIIKLEISEAFKGLPDIMKAPFIYLRDFIQGFGSQLIKELGIQQHINYLKQEWRVFLSVLDIDPELLGKFGVIADKIRSSWIALSNTIGQKIDYIKQEWRVFTFLLDSGIVYQNFSNKFTRAIQIVENKWSKLINYIQTKEFGETLVVGINKVQIKWGQFVDWLNRTPLFLNILSEVNNLSRRYAVTMRQMKRSWLQFRETLGATDWITESLAKIKNWTTGVEERLLNMASNIPIFGNIVENLFDINAVFVRVISWIEKKWEGLSTFLRNTSLIPNFFNLNQEMGRGMAWLSETAKAGWQPFLNWLNNTNLFDKFFDKLRAIAPQIPIILQSIIPEIKTAYDKLLQNLPQSSDEAIGRIVGAWEGLKQKVSNILSTLLTFIREKIGVGVIRALNCRPTVVIPQAWEQAGEKIKTTLLALLERVRDIGKGIVRYLTQMLPQFSKFWEGFKDGFKFSVQPAIAELKPTIIATFDALVSRLKTTGEFIEKVKQYFTELRQSIRSVSQTPINLSGGQTNLGALLAQGLGTGIRLLNKTLKLLAPVVSLVERLTVAVGGFAVTVVGAITQRVLPPLVELWQSFKKILRIANLVGKGIQTAFNLVGSIVQFVIPDIQRVNTETRETRNQFALLFKVGKALGTFIGELFVLPIRGINLLINAIDSIVTAIITVKNTFTNVSDSIQNQIEGFKGKVETVKDTVNNAFIAPLNTVKNKWTNTTDFIGNTINKLRGRTEGVGREIQGNIAEASPGPTFMIRKYWGMTADYVLNQVKAIAGASQTVDQAFEGTRSALIRLNQESRQMNNPLKQLGLSAMPNSLQELKTAYRQAAMMAHPDRGGNTQQFSEVESAYQQLKAQMGGAVDIPINTRSSVEVDTSQMKEMARLSREQMGSLRQGFTSLGMALSNFAPQLATPMFIALDLVDAFADLKTALPAIKALLFGTQIAANTSSTAIVVANAAVGTSATTTAATVAAANTTIGLSSLTMGGIVTAVQGFIVTGFKAIASVATATYVAVTGLLFPLIAALSLLGGTVAGLYLGFKHNFLGIRDILMGAWEVLRAFFGTLFGGAWDTIQSVLITFENTVGVIFRTIVGLGKAIAAPFMAMVGVNAEAMSFLDILKQGATNIAKFLLLPLRLTAFTVNTLLQGIQLTVRILTPIATITGTILAHATALAMKIVGIVGLVVGGVAAFKGVITIMGGITATLGLVSAFFAAPASIMGVMAATLPVVGSIISFIAGSVGVIAPIIGAVGSAFAFLGTVALPAIATYAAPILGILTAIVGVGWVLSKSLTFAFKVISGVVQGIGNIFNDVFGVFVGEIKAITSLLFDIGKLLFSPFQNLFNLIGLSNKQTNNFLGTGAKLMVKAILLPLEIVAISLTTIIKGISLIIKSALILGKTLLGFWLFPIKQIQSAIRFILTPFKAIASVISTIGQVIFNAVLNPIQTIFGLLSKLPFIGRFLDQGGMGNNIVPFQRSEPVPGFSTGGWINGAGSGTSDSIPAFLSNGEFVVNAKAAADNGPLLEKINDGKLETVYRNPYDAPTLPSSTSTTTINKKEIGDINVNFEFSGNIVIQGEGKDKKQLASEILEELVVQFGPQIDRILKERLTYMTELTKG